MNACGRMRRRTTFFGHISWSAGSVQIEDKIAHEKTTAEFPDLVRDAQAMDHSAFILTSKQLFRLDLSTLHVFVLSLEDIGSGWTLSTVQCTRSSLPVSIDRLNHFGLHRLTASDKIEQYSSDRPNALLACTDQSAFLAVNNCDSTRLFKVFDAEATNDNISPSMIQLGLPDSDSVVQMVAGKAHVVLLDSQGHVLTFGTGSRGELGHGSLASEQQPLTVDALSEIKIVFVAAGGWHSAAVTNDGDVYLWGWNDSGQLGVDSTEMGTCSLPLPLDLPEGVQVRKVACGSRHTLLLCDNREVLGCGINDYGQLGEAGVRSILGLYCLGEKICDIDAAAWTSVLYE